MTCCSLLIWLKLLVDMFYTLLVKRRYLKSCLKIKFAQFSKKSPLDLQAPLAQHLHVGGVAVLALHQLLPQALQLPRVGFFRLLQLAQPGGEIPDVLGRVAQDQLGHFLRLIEPAPEICQLGIAGTFQVPQFLFLSQWQQPSTIEDLVRVERRQGV